MAIIPVQLARVSNLLRTSVAQQTISRTQAALLRVQSELSTGQRLNAPSDDPGDAAVVVQLQKTLEQRQAYARNLDRAVSHLGEADSALGELGALLQQAQTIASANVGSDVTPEQRHAAAEIVQSLYRQAVTLASRQFESVYLFGGDRSTAPPFVEETGGIRFVGSGTVLSNAYDENLVLPFMVDGAEVFAALSTRVQGSADLTPALTSQTRLIDLNGTTAQGVRLGSIRLGNGTTSAVVDLSGADSIGDVVNTINAAGVGSITASISGSSLLLSGGAGDDITVSEVGGTTASDLGILRANGAGAGLPLSGTSVAPKVTSLTPLASLRGGADIDPAGLIITNGSQSATIDLSTATTVEDLLNAINGSSVSVRAQINAAGTGIDILNPVQGAKLTIGENGGTTAADLGVRSFSPQTPLSELNSGRGVRTVAGDDLRVTRKDGTSFTVDLSGLSSVQDVIDAINAADGGGGVSASFATSGNGIVLSDSTGGGGTLGVTPLNYSYAAADLGLLNAESGGAIVGSDVNPVTAQGVFANLAKLRDALLAGDHLGITQAAEGLRGDTDRVVRLRGQSGARVQELEARQQRLADQTVATTALLSSLKDTDFTEAISRFQTLQTSLQASLQASAAGALTLSLMDFLD